MKVWLLSLLVSLPAFANEASDKFIREFRKEFQAGSGTVYKLGARGPKYYDCSTSMGFIFARQGLLYYKGVKLTVDQYRVSSYNPAYFDRDTENFNKLSATDTLQAGDIILMGASCQNPSHWVVISGIGVADQGQLQSNWRKNWVMEVKGDGDNSGRYFEESYDHIKFKNNNLCAVVRHKAF